MTVQGCSSAVFVWKWFVEFQKKPLNSRRGATWRRHNCSSALRWHRHPQLVSVASQRTIQELLSRPQQQCLYRRFTHAKQRLKSHTRNNRDRMLPWMIFKIKAAHRTKLRVKRFKQVVLNMIFIKILKYKPAWQKLSLFFFNLFWFFRYCECFDVLWLCLLDYKLLHH